MVYAICAAMQVHLHWDDADVIMTGKVEEPSICLDFGMRFTS